MQFCGSAGPGRFGAIRKNKVIAQEALDPVFLRPPDFNSQGDRVFGGFLLC